MDDPGTLGEKLTGFCQEADSHREAARSGDLGDGLRVLHERLLRARAGVDRVEEIVASLGRVRRDTSLTVEGCQDALEDAYARLVTAPSSHGGDQWTTGHERDAQRRLQTVSERLDLRRAQRVDGDVVAAYEYAKVKHRGLLDSCRTIEVRIRLIALEGQLER